MKLRNHPYAQCFVKELDGCTILTSYCTDVIVIDHLGWLHVTGLYSVTTRKHIGYFLKEYVPILNFQFIKKLYQDNMAYNIYTGEVKDVDSV